MRHVSAAVILATILVVAACGLEPGAHQGSQEAWQARDAERAQECQREGGRYFSGSCLRGGGP